MFLFGWGKNSRRWDLDHGYMLVATWSYFHVFFCPVAFNKKWHLIGDNRSEDRVISYDQVRQLVPTNTPQIGLWQRYGLIGALGIFGVLIMWSELTA